MLRPISSLYENQARERHSASTRRDIPLFRATGTTTNPARTPRVWVKGPQSWGGNIHKHSAGAAKVGDFFGGSRLGPGPSSSWELMWGLARLGQTAAPEGPRRVRLCPRHMQAQTREHCTVRHIIFHRALLWHIIIGTLYKLN